MASVFTSNGIFSTIKYTGSPIVSKFKTTTENQELVLFRPKDSTVDNPKILRCNSVTIEASTADLAFVLIRESLSSKDVDLTTFDFTDEPVIYVDAETSKTISGTGIIGVKFANNLGAEYSISALSI